MEIEGQHISRASLQERRCIGHERWSLLQYCNLYVLSYKHWHEALFSVERWSVPPLFVAGRLAAWAHRRRCQSEMELDGKTAQPSREQDLLFRRLGKDRGS